MTAEEPTGDSQQQKPQRRVALFGISGDPPTGYGGHVGIAQQLLDHLGDAVDEIRILPVYRHTFVEKQQRLIPYDDRLAMCRLAFGPLRKQEQSPNQVDDATTTTSTQIVVSNAEYESWKWATQGRQATDVCVGTAALMDYLHHTEPHTVFSFCLGADSFCSLLDGKWQETDRVLALMQGRFIVVNRIYPTNHGQQNQATTDIQDQERRALQERVASVPGAILLPPNPALGTVSSSQVRSWLKEQGSSSNELVDRPERIVPSVLEYIQQHGLYQPDK
uniref:Nicotinamide-nucleotide adenylyltransferase n=1 Tax=Entomoneis paludosa TaxID=265537 RepID=A0A7S3DQZ2_9STRA|mmetsp:Transcript_29295/g.61297  ORF Transcript_29295/g.61297 Transcript_29295/m.61297 type:complete len:277 (+) Transcript_29295:45-875(+)|eukprot:CAMPEP_0172453114 /NCGR_PEP_ID=MMETSP1065-20121228/10580_1 /TAXON_ID=265537 /ORGANISM="Amphiprora paludosa, Strain CCMP125" /LENGTH=276 /DNA_ID=CAMNT_0013205283 /DNA_START=20 /DNA_END=850 /DNA_ORIENTATION=-